MFLAFLICAGVIFLKWKGHFSFWGSAFQVFRQCGGASIRTSAKRKIYFSGGKDFSALPQAVFVFSPRGGGVWGGIRAGFGGGGYFFQSLIIKCLALSSTTNFCFSFHLSFLTYSIGKVMEKLLPPATLESFLML